MSWSQCQIARNFLGGPQVIIFYLFLWDRMDGGPKTLMYNLQRKPMGGHKAQIHGITQPPNPNSLNRPNLTMPFGFHVKYRYKTTFASNILAKVLWGGMGKSVEPCPAQLRAVTTTKTQAYWDSMRPPFYRQLWVFILLGCIWLFGVGSHWAFCTTAYSKCYYSILHFIGMPTQNAAILNCFVG